MNYFALDMIKATVIIRLSVRNPNLKIPGLRWLEINLLFTTLVRILISRPQKSFKSSNFKKKINLSRTTFQFPVDGGFILRSTSAFH